MATKTTVLFFCDLPRHKEPVEATHKNVPLRFGRQDVEVDLCDSCHAELKAAFEPLIQAGRKADGRRVGPQKRTPSRSTTSASRRIPTVTDPRPQLSTSATSNGHVSKPANGKAKKIAKSAPRTLVPPSPSTVRAWAQSNGISVAPRGAIKREVVQQFVDAHS